MKAVKLIFSTVAALWALALVLLLPAKLAVARSRGIYAPSYIIGAVVGIVVAAGISLLLFRSAFRKRPPSPPPIPPAGRSGAG